MLPGEDSLMGAAVHWPALFFLYARVDVVWQSIAQCGVEDPRMAVFYVHT